MKIPFLIFKLLIGLVLLVWMQVQVGGTVFPCGDHYYSLTEIHSYKILNRYLDNNLDSNFVKHSDTFDIIDLSYVFEFEYQLYDTSANDTKERQTECNWIMNEFDSVKVWKVYPDTLEEYTKYFNLGPNDLNAINSQERRPIMVGNTIPPRCLFLWNGLYNDQNNIPFQDSCQFRFDFYLPDIGKLSQLTESVFIAE